MTEVPTDIRQPRLRWARWLALAAGILVLDQTTKMACNAFIPFADRVHVLPFFDFTLVYNRGAAFSFLAGQDGWQRWLFTALGVAASVFIIWLLRRNARQPLFCLALTLILGGAVGNVVDRVLYGHVIDFLLFYWNHWYFPAFNLADVAITCGAVLLVIDELLRKRRQRDGTADHAPHS